jgi:SAM-dependent methyltransferase
LPADARIVGVDHEAGFRDRALARASRLDLADRFDFRQGSINALPFAKDTFDCVTCQTVLMHVGDAPGAINEMTRVCRPGGIVIAAEPNNFVNALQFLCVYPRVPWPDVERFLRFDHLCREGKRTLGEGDTAIGERLPSLFADAGLTHLGVFSNDECGTLLPPYGTARERTNIDQLFEFFGAEVSLAGGPKSEARRRFLAGGGTEDEFSASWDLVMRLQRDLEAAIRAGSVSAARGFLHYVVSGRKPGRG